MGMQDSCIVLQVGGGYRSGASDKLTPAAKYLYWLIFKKSPTFRVWCLYRYLVHAIMNSKLVRLLLCASASLFTCLLGVLFCIRGEIQMIPESVNKK